jgi:hypothetical protein
VKHDFRPALRPIAVRDGAAVCLHNPQAKLKESGDESATLPGVRLAAHV